MWEGVGAAVTPKEEERSSFSVISGHVDRLNIGPGIENVLRSLGGYEARASFHIVPR